MNNKNTLSKTKILNQWYFIGIHWIVQKILSFRTIRGLGALATFFQTLLPNPGPGKYLLETKWGVTVGFFPDLDPVGLESRLYRTGIYEMGVIRQLENWVQPGDFLIDAGANIGWLSLHMAALTGRKGQVWAFEPHPLMHQILLENISLNPHLVIKPFHKGLGHTFSESVLFENPHINRGGASFINSSGESTGWPVSLIPLDSLVPEFPQSPALLKIDVEGWELEVLKGANQILAAAHRPKLIIEYSLERPATQKETELFDFLQAKRYSVWKLSNGKERRGELVPVKTPGDLPIHDNLFCWPE